MPGGAAAIREPWRMAVSCLFHHFGRDFLNLPISFVRQLNAHKTGFLLRMIQQQINSPLTSSCGRLFDAVSALVGIRQQINYEAQAAIELEFAIQENGDDAYPVEITQTSQPWLIRTGPMFASLIEDLRQGLADGTIARRFHNGLVNGFLNVAVALRQNRGLNRVCLSGGTFHNVYLAQRLEAALSAKGFEVFTHHEVPAGDGGLSLGQALVAAYTFRAKSQTVV